MPGVEFIQCTTQSDYLCSGQIFLEEFNNINQGFSTPCTILEYSGKELEDYLIDGFPEIVQFNKVDERFSTIELDHPHFSWNKKPTILLSYTFDIPEKTLVHQESIVVSLWDLIGIVGGTLGLYVGFNFFDSFFQLIEYCEIVVDAMKEIVKKIKSRKIGIQKNNSTVKKQPKSVQEKPKKSPDIKQQA